MRSITLAVHGSAAGAASEITGTRLLARATRCTAIDQCDDEYSALGTGAIDSTGHHRTDVPWLVIVDPGVYPVIIEVIVQSRDAGRVSYEPAIDTVLVDTRIDTTWVHVDLVAGS